MPVPVQTTGWTGQAGIDSQTLQHTELPSTGGLFSSLGASSVPAAPAPRAAPAAAVAASATTASPAAPFDASRGDVTVKIDGLNFSYPGIDGSPQEGVPPLIENMELTLREGDRCLLVGPNGAGKTTLLKILGGKHMIPEKAVKVLDRPVFHDTHLTSSGTLAYIGGNWQRDVAFAGYNIPLQGDFPASKMLNSVPGIDPVRRAKIIDVLDVDVNWRMHQVSDGQRRRVQLAYGLLKPFKVLLLDEITVDLDVLGRADLMEFLKEECSTRGATVIYVTHIFDGLEEWATRLAYVANGKMEMNKPLHELCDIGAPGSLLAMIEVWLRKDKEEREAREEREGRPKEKKIEFARNNGWAAGRNMSSMNGGAALTDGAVSMAGSSNAVWRC